ncbi:MAG: ribonuclease P protein component [Bacteroidales bacterium]
MGKNKFPKEERIKRLEIIFSLFGDGNVTKSGDIKIIWKYSKINEPGKTGPFIQAGFSVPKKNIKKAVQRNRIKRKMREAFRIRKNILTETLKNKNIKLYLFFIYLPVKELSFQEIEHNFISGTQKVVDSIALNNFQK